MSNLAKSVVHFLTKLVRTLVTGHFAILHQNCNRHPGFICRLSLSRYLIPIQRFCCFECDKQ